MVEDLRIMIGQEIGLDYLIPVAVAELEREPLAEGDYYPGDLLANVIRCGEWLRLHPDLLVRVVGVAQRAAAGLGTEDDELRQRFNVFVASSPGRTSSCT